MQPKARGGTDVAMGDSSLSQIDNPATLTLWLRKEHRVGLAGQLAFPFVESLSAGGKSDTPLGIDYGHSTIEQVQHSICFGFGFSW